MILKVIGAIFVVTSCGGIGFRIAANHCREETNLRQMIGILDYLECELQYRLTPLPELCTKVANMFSGVVGNAFLELRTEMDAQVLPNISTCMGAAVAKSSKLTPLTKEELLQLGKTVGQFDLEGQMKGLEAIRQDCKRRLDGLSQNRDSRLRSYQTLGLCAGAALAILFI